MFGRLGDISVIVEFFFVPVKTRAYCVSPKFIASPFCLMARISQMFSHYGLRVFMALRSHRCNITKRFTLGKKTLRNKNQLVRYNIYNRDICDIKA